MARYSAFLGRRVEVQYRAGDILLPASGTFVADSGRSIFLEQHFEQRGQQKHFRWEIPYQYVVRLEEKVESVPAALGDAATAKPAPSAGSADLASEATSGIVEAQSSSTAVAGAAGGPSTLLPVGNRPKTA